MDELFTNVLARLMDLLNTPISERTGADNAGISWMLWMLENIAITGRYPYSIMPEYSKVDRKSIVSIRIDPCKR